MRTTKQRDQTRSQDHASHTEQYRAPARWLRRLILWTLSTIAIGIVSLGFLMWHVFQKACTSPCVDLMVLEEFQPNEATRILDRYGKEIATFYLENRRLIPLEEIPMHLINAFVAIEDLRFFEHQGIDLPRVLGAVRANIRSRRVSEGFSTITMQLARNTYPDFLPMEERSMGRKLREVRVALEIEARFSKDEILERYLNTIFLGAGAYGVEAAARTYFGKSTQDLTLAEAALLAGLPKAPSAYNPYRHPEAAIRRRNLVLDTIERAGLSSPAEIAAARADPLTLAYETSAEARRSSTPRVGAHFVETVRQILDKQLGGQLYRGGLVVRTTLDPPLQEAAESTLRTHLELIEADIDSSSTAAGPLEGALVLMSIDSGEVLAWSGGRDFEHSSFDRARQAVRQPGSAFKPFLYAAALEAGLNPWDSISDAAIILELEDGELWGPRNFSGPEANQDSLLSLTDALRLSRNRAAVHLAEEIGIDVVASLAERAGVGANLPRVPSLALGSGGVRMIDLLAAYTVFARGDGTRTSPRLITSVEDRRGKILYREEKAVRKVISPYTATAVRDMLRESVDRGTGTGVRTAGFHGQVAGKTGTTNNATDTWFVGVTPSHAAAVWIGFDQPRQILPGAAGTGGRLAAPVWAEFMKRVPEDTASRWPAIDLSLSAPLTEDGSLPAEDTTTPRLPVASPRLCIIPPESFARPDTVRSFLAPCPPTQ